MIFTLEASMLMVRSLVFLAMFHNGTVFHSVVIPAVCPFHFYGGLTRFAVRLVGVHRQTGIL